MKKIAVLLLLIGFGFVAKSQTLGVGLAYGSKVKAGGIQAMVEFGLGDHVAIAPNLLFYFAKVWEGNVDLKFFFGGTDAVSPYAIGGLNVITASGNTELGANLGIGSNFGLGGATKIFAEGKYELSSADQLVISAGIKFPL